MKCPRCGGEIPLFDLKPNCRHCGVNIMYFSQHEGLARDAKRTELEAGAMRLVLARVKANFIGGKLQITRLVFILLAVASLLVPYGAVKFTVPLYEGGVSVGAIGLFLAYSSGLLLRTPSLLSSALFAKYTAAAVTDAAFFAISLICCLLLFASFLLGFLNLTRSEKFMRAVSLIGAVSSFIGQIASVVLSLTAAKSSLGKVDYGFGAIVSCALFLVVFFISSALLKKGVEPEYKENDIKRKAMLKRVRKGEVDLDELPLPVFESAEEHEKRLKELEEALKAEEEEKEL